MIRAVRHEHPDRARRTRPTNSINTAIGQPRTPRGLTDDVNSAADILRRAPSHHARTPGGREIRRERRRQRREFRIYASSDGIAHAGTCSAAALVIRPDRRSSAGAQLGRPHLCASWVCRLSVLSCPSGRVPTRRSPSFVFEAHLAGHEPGPGRSRRVAFGPDSDLAPWVATKSRRTARASCEAAIGRATPLTILIGGLAPELSRTAGHARGRRVGACPRNFDSDTKGPSTRHRASVAGERFVADGADGVAR